MNYFILIFILLSAIGFFNPSGVLSAQAEKFLLYAAIAGGAVYAFSFGRNLTKVKYPRIAYAILIGGIFLSIFTSTAFHDQSLTDSFKTVLSYLLPYFSFFVFMKLDVPREKVMNTLIILSFIAAFAYFVNLYSVPSFSFGRPLEKEDLSRGILRIAIPYIELFPLLLFYSINQWFMTRAKKWLFYGAFLMVMIFLSVTRQIIFLSAILGLIYLLQNVTLFKKITVIVVVVLFGTIVLPRIPAYKTMLELSEEQRDENEDEENIRIQAWRYYTIENQTNEITPIIGNGVPSFGLSPWGKQFESDTDTNKCFAVDVGWAGFFYYFGAITTAALLIILIRAFLLRKPKSQTYLNYWILFLIATSVASGIILYYFQIVSVSLVLYLVYKGKDEPSHRIENQSENTQVKPYKGYQQLSMSCRHG
ncbi:MAG: hypothetical protein ACI31E_01350 [Muribaculaceae bacterium]